jgi:hypothetical protein
MVKIIVRTITPKSMNVRQYEDKLRDVVKQEVGIVERMYMRVSRGFSAPQPKYKKTVRKQPARGGVIVGTVSTDDVRMVNLDRGTRCRWAVMSQDFRPRTTPRTLGIKGRQGRAVIRGRRAMTARGIAVRPGIQPRHWTDEIAERREQLFHNKMRKAMKLAADHTF